MLGMVLVLFHIQLVASTDLLREVHRDERIDMSFGRGFVSLHCRDHLLILLTDLSLQGNGHDHVRMWSS